MHCVADFCLVPMGVDTVGVTKYIAECQRVLDKSGLSYQLHGYGTGVQGEYGAVMKVIEECHEAVHAMGCPRIATDIRIGTRTDKQGSLEAKVASVTDLLAKDKKPEEGSSSTESKEPELPTRDGPLA
ncbi:YkoF-like protein [Leucosporidium creatinivorum]|uniref:YkoF-like protein n=1 Tax=Leucosporidium creatinivorum TaxID=106004 RepID=A0A1Y2EL67_9BASI|nr:YkoF-like protein [Leucosporidium creatinivorum]